jgi:hypothetical protein
MGNTCDLQLLGQGVGNSNPTDWLLYHVLVAISELERVHISDRANVSVGPVYRRMFEMKKAAD